MIALSMHSICRTSDAPIHDRRRAYHSLCT